MAALRKKDLVKDGKYNRAEIMKRAWAYKTDRFCTMYRDSFNRALSAAWSDARSAMKDYLFELTDDGIPYFNKNVSVAMLRSVSCSIDMRNGNVCW
jgi:hypothetical protein